MCVSLHKGISLTSQYFNNMLKTGAAHVLIQNTITIMLHLKEKLLLQLALTGIATVVCHGTTFDL